MAKTNPFPHILVGADPKGHFAPACRRALQLKEKLGSSVSFVCAVEIPPPMWPGLREKELATMHAAAVTHSREECVEVLASIAKEFDVPQPDLESHLDVVVGPPAKVLLDRLALEEVDLVLLGPHEKRSLFDFGSTGRAVLARTATPVWIQADAPGKIESILVAYDFSEHSKRALAHARDLAQAQGASITVLHCYVPPAFAYATAASSLTGPTYVIDAERDKSREEFERQMGEYDFGELKVETEFTEGSPVEVLREHAKKADLLVMGSHGRTGLSRFLLGSVAYGCLKRSPAPVLVVPSPSRTWLLDEPAPEREAQILP